VGVQQWPRTVDGGRAGELDRGWKERVERARPRKTSERTSNNAETAQRLERPAMTTGPPDPRTASKASPSPSSTHPVPSVCSAIWSVVCRLMPSMISISPPCGQLDPSASVSVVRGAPPGGYTTWIRSDSDLNAMWLECGSLPSFPLLERREATIPPHLEARLGATALPTATSPPTPLSVSVANYTARLDPTPPLTLDQVARSRISTLPLRLRLLRYVPLTSALSLRLFRSAPRSSPFSLLPSPFSLLTSHCALSPYPPFLRDARPDQTSTSPRPTHASKTPARPNIHKACAPRP
jgi:hypothetical protein